MMHEDLSEHGSSSDGSDTQTSKLDWRRAHEDLSRLARCRARLDWEEGRSLLDALRSGAHLHLGFGSFGEYIERSEEHTSELQSRLHLVCRLLLEKKKKNCCLLRVERHNRWIKIIAICVHTS